VTSLNRTDSRVVVESIKQESIWSIASKNVNYEYYRLSPLVQGLRDWADKAYYGDDLAVYLDKDFLRQFRNNDFFARLWELELVSWLKKAELNLVPVVGKGPDFRIDLDDGRKIWIEAVLSRPDDRLKKIQEDAFKSNGHEYNTPRDDTALRYATNLGAKAEKIRDRYSDIVSKDDYVLIAISAFAPSAMWPSIDLFMRAVLPINDQLIHFSINGIIFSEASDLQLLLGTWSSRFDDTTRVPHIFQSYASADLPPVFTKAFYYHRFREKGTLVTMDMIEPSHTSAD
jgi:hypothetical protein